MKRIGFHAGAGVLVIVGNGSFPARSLMLSDAEGGRFQIWSLAGRAEQLVDWDEVATLDGGTFASHGAARAYLEAEFAKAPEADRLVGTYPAGRDLGGQRVVAISEDEALAYASSDDPLSASRAIGVTLGAVDAGALAEVVTAGPLDEPSWAFAPGPVFLGLDGLPTQAPPLSGYVLRIGTAVSPTRLLVALDEPYFLAA